MRFSRDWAGEFGTTPARFDMMVAISRGKGITQADLRRTLDVCGSVVSRMLESLKRLGLVVAALNERDRRTKWIALTRRGSFLVEDMCSELLQDAFTEIAIRSVVSSLPGNRVVTERALVSTNRRLRTLRRRVSDASTLWYPCYLRSDARSPDFPAPYPDEPRASAASW